MNKRGFQGSFRLRSSDIFKCSTKLTVVSEKLISPGEKKIKEHHIPIPLNFSQYKSVSLSRRSFFLGLEIEK
jgi:hypothetical protein